MIEKLPNLIYRSGISSAYNDETLTQYEYLCLIYKKLDEIIETVNNSDFDKIEKIIDSKIANLKVFVNEQNNITRNLISTTATETLQNSISYSNEIISKTVDLLQVFVKEQDNLLFIKLDNMMKLLQHQIDTIESEGR